MAVGEVGHRQPRASVAGTHLSHRARWRAALPLLAPIAVGTLLSVVAVIRKHNTSPDSWEYIAGGVSLWSGRGFHGVSGEDQLVFPPLYPLLLGAVHRVVPDPVLAGLLVAVVASSLSLLLLYLLASRLFSPRSAVAATWLFALLPLRVSASAMVWSESLYGALIVAALLLWLLAVRRAALSLIAGAAFGLAYLTRPEGLIVFLGCAAIALAQVARARAGARQAGLRVALALAGLAVIAFPYALYLHAHTGRWQLSGKLDANLRVADLRSSGVPWQELRRLSADDRTVVPPTYRDSVAALAARYARNVRAEGQLLAAVIGPFAAALFGLGLVGLWSAPRRPAAAVALGALALPLLALPVFFVEDRMLLGSTLALLLVCGAGLTGVAPAETAFETAARKAGRALFAASLLWLCLCSSALLAAREPKIVATAGPMQAAMRRASDHPGPVVGNGELAAALAQLTGRACLPLPWESRARVVRYARYHGASFLLLKSTDHPDLAQLALHPTATEDLVPLFHAETNDGTGSAKRYQELYLIRPRPAAGPL